MRELIEAAVDGGLLPLGPRHRCVYLPGRYARSTAFHAEELDPGTYQWLMDRNFRRSGYVFYRPECQRCRQCRALRVPVDQFRPNRAQRRCRQRNRDVAVQVAEPVPSEEKHELYRRYLSARHAGDMDGSWEEFVGFLYQSPLRTLEAVYRVSGKLLAVGITDLEPQAASTVYCYFDPAAAARSPGVFNILWWIERCRVLGLPWLYLGYYVADCPKMNYKANYQPCEVLEPDGHWHRMERQGGVPAPCGVYRPSARSGPSERRPSRRGPQ